MAEPKVIPFERSRPVVLRDQADPRLNGTLSWYRDDTAAWDGGLDGAGARLCYTTGVAGLDEMTSGLMQGNVYVVAGRTGAGKSSFALTTTLTLACADGPAVLYVSLEMPREDMALRGIAWLTGISQARLLAASIGRVRLTDDERQAVSLAHRWFKRKVRMMAGNFSVEEIRREAAALHADGGLSVVVCDHVGLVRPERATRGESREREVAAASRGLKTLAMELNVAVLTLAQMNRGADKDKEPELRHLRESGSIEQDAAVVSFLWPAEGGARDRARIFVRKNRFGMLGDFETAWDGASGRLGEAAEVYA